MKINRKKFFLTAASSILGITFLKNFSFSVFRNKDKSDNGKIKVKINPSAVSRKSKEYTNA